MSERNFREMLEVGWAKNKFVSVGLDNFDRLDVFSIIDATKDHVCAFKLNTEFYLGKMAFGMSTLHRVSRYIHHVAPEVPIILDRKAGDIDTTNHGTVEMAFDYLMADAITVNPYFGYEAMKPFLNRKNTGVIVLCRTSNLGAGEFQDLPVRYQSPRVPECIHIIPFYQYVAYRVVTEWNTNGNCALVVGATCPGELSEVRKIVGDLPILIPGIGAQGGDLEKTIAAGKDRRGKGMIINSSRGIIFADNPREETKKLNDAINHCLHGGAT